MKVKDLIEHLKQCNQDAEVELKFVEYENMQNSVDPLFSVREYVGKNNIVYLLSEDADAYYDEE